MHMEKLRTHLAGCTRCRLGKTRKNLVFGEGNPDAHIMFVGEAPGAIEDRSGRPFVGQAGRFLRRAMERCGIPPEESWIANIIKCRPPSNRDPKPDEIDTCSPFLHEQIALVNPHILVALGRFAGNLLVDMEGLSMQTLRRQERFYPPTYTRVICCYHPMAVKYRYQEGSVKYLRMFVQDLKEARRLADKAHREARLFEEL